MRFWDGKQRTLPVDPSDPACGRAAMSEEYRERLEKARQKEAVYKKLAGRLKKKKPADLDRFIHEADEDAFACTDCLHCANCCKTTGPKFTDRDIDRIAGHLGMKPGTFMQQHLQKDEDGDLVLKVLPCPFLADDNYCSIYEVRPKACADYPHTRHRKMYKHMPLMQRNSLICPAVARIFEKLEEHYT